MSLDDETRFMHMLESSRDACRFIEGKNRPDLAHDRVLVLALIKCIEIVGEAASRVSPAGRERIPGIPWVDVVGMRNRLIHGYYDVDFSQVWLTVTEDLPLLIAELEKMLPPQ